MFEVGRVCMKIAGRDAGKVGVVIDKIDDNYVLIDGQTRRRKCNISHLEVTSHVVKVKKNASNAEVAKALSELKIEVIAKKDSKKESKPRPKKIKVKKSDLREEKPKKRLGFNPKGK